VITTAANPADIILAPSTTLRIISLRVDTTFIIVCNFTISIIGRIVLLRFADITAPALKNIRVKVGHNVPVVATDTS